MASTYVNDLRLNEMATGDGSGTWGTTTNTNLELIAEAFSYGTEVITTNADTHTTTIADGATDPGRSLYLKYTGTLDSACTITIGPNTVSKVWIIENGTSGSQNIIISQGSGANITIPAGDTKVVYSDGAGAGAAFFDAFANLKVTDPAQTNITSVGTLTGFTSTGIDDNATSTAITIDSSENVGIGLAAKTSATTLTVENASGYAPTLLLNQSGIGAASIAVPASVNALQFNYFDGSSLTEAMRIDGSGNVGIGTSSPAQLIHGKTASGNAYMRIERASQSTGQVGLQIGGGTSSVDWFTYMPASSNDLAFFGNSAERMRIDASGNVGIGTSSPSQKLEVAGNIYVGGGNYYTQATSGYFFGGNNFFTNGVYGVGVNNMAFNVNGSERVRIDSSGNLLVGMTSASYLEADSGVQLYEYGGARFGADGTAARNLLSFVNGTDGTPAEVGFIQTNGSSTSYVTSSDQRLKENIADADDAGSKIDAIQVRKFDWKVDGSHQDYGMVAQELQAVAPEAVSVPEDPEKMMGVDYSKLVPMLVKEIQSLRTRITALES
jgi:hypothetical protein